MKTIPAGAARVQQRTAFCHNRRCPTSHGSRCTDDFIGRGAFAGHRGEKRRDINRIALAVHNRTDALAGLGIGQVLLVQKVLNSGFQDLVHFLPARIGHSEGNPEAAAGVSRIISNGNQQSSTEHELRNSCCTQLQTRSELKGQDSTMGGDDLTHDEPVGELEIEGSETACSYLPGQTARMTYRLAYRLTESRYEQLLSRGWRRFGRTLFRPNCSACAACQSLRVVLADFTASKSQRRIVSKAPEFSLTIQKPTVSAEHLSLYNRYHLDMHHRRQWPFREIDSDHYFDSFLDGHFSFAREFQYRHDGKLIGLGLVDMTRSVMSSIYFFHDPDWRDVALGTYSVLREIEVGKTQGCQWLYMGYYIRDCGSMNYKNRFRPNQILEKSVADEQLPDWPTQVE